METDGKVEPTSNADNLDKRDAQELGPSDPVTSTCNSNINSSQLTSSSSKDNEVSDNSVELPPNDLLGKNDEEKLSDKPLSESVDCSATADESRTEKDSPNSPIMCVPAGDETSEGNPSESSASKTDLQTEPTLQIVNSVSLVEVCNVESKADSECPGIFRNDEVNESSPVVPILSTDSEDKIQNSNNASLHRQGESAATVEKISSRDIAGKSRAEACIENTVSSPTDTEHPSDCGLKIASSGSIQETQTENTDEALDAVQADVCSESGESLEEIGVGNQDQTVRSPKAGEPMDCGSPKSGNQTSEKEDVPMETDEESQTERVSTVDVGMSKACSDTDGGDMLSTGTDYVKSPENAGDPLNSSKPPSPTESEGKDSESVDSEPSTGLLEKESSEEIVINNEPPAALAENEKADDVLEDNESSTTSNKHSETVNKDADTKDNDEKGAESELEQRLEEQENGLQSTGDKSGVNALQEDAKSSAIADGDNEVCIVPDAEPRVPSEKEKANAVEKANKVAEAAADVSEKGDSEFVREGISRPSEEEENSSKDKSSDTTEKDTSDSSASRRKFGIQLVSTSALVSKQGISKESDESESATDTQTPGDNESTTQTVDSIESQAQRDIQTVNKGEQKCGGCQKLIICKYKVKDVPLCEDECYSDYRKKHDPPLIRPRKLTAAYMHKCGLCCKKVDTKNEKSLTWETMDFCCDGCLEKYQKSFGSHCANCKGAVQSSSLGKYCVRFGYDMKQFCCAPCLEDFKKGLKVCSYCQKDISGGSEGFLAPVGDKSQFKDFCTQECMEKYDLMSNNTVAPEVTCECAVCNKVKVVKVEIIFDSKVQKLCSDPCFAAFKFVNKVSADQCDMCRKYYDQDRIENFSVFYDDAPHSFCCKTCMNVYILAKRKIVPCSFCKVKKYNFDMIKKTSNGQVLMLCSLHCLHLHARPPQASAPKKPTCEHCNSSSPAQFHLTMSDASVRSFCSSNCVLSFQAKFPKTPVTTTGVDKTPYPLGVPRKIAGKKIAPLSAPEKDLGSSDSGTMPVISSVTSLAPASGPLPQPAPSLSPTPTPAVTVATQSVETVKTVYKQQFIIRPPPHPEMTNCGVQVKPKSLTKGVSCRPHACSVGTQTETSMLKPLVIPVPVPIFIPIPMHMYTSPYPVPVPIALPIPVPIFIPTTRNSAKGIFKEIKRIQEKMPSDPYEAELLMMAEMVANEKKAENTDTDSDDGADGAADGDVNEAENTAESDFNSENVDGSNTFGEDVLQMALKMASELDEPAVDFESTVTPNTIPQTASTQQTSVKSEDSDEDETEERSTQSNKKRTIRTNSRPSSVNSKRARKSSTNSDHTSSLPTAESKGFPTVKGELVEKADANMCLKFTLGVNAWKGWVSQKNAELEKSENAARKMKLFKPDLLQLSADELNYSLCLFVKEVRKPNGEEYAPDTVYYLCLGIQQYLIENGRVDNIFSDPYFEKFTVCLDEITKQFSSLCNESQQLVTRIEEEHLWESKQLGAHSPHVLLSTLMYFNTKYFSLMTVDEHLQLSFSHIMKHWKRNQGTPIAKAGGSRNVLLRFYPPQAALAANSKKKRVYEQQEDENNPLRCPVKLYEFYISKCPESVRTRNDVFYLLPERSCVPDSPVWYSTMPLGNEHLQKMLNRIKMVKEILML